MNLNELNAYLLEKLMLLEAGKQFPGPKFDPEKHHWLTINGARVMVNEKGKAVGGPAKLKDNMGGTYTTQTQENTDKLLGKNSGFEATETDGKTEFGHKDIDEKVVVNGASLFDTLTAMMSYVDVLTAATMKATGALGKTLDRALGNLKEVLDMWVK